MLFLVVLTTVIAGSQAWPRISYASYTGIPRHIVRSGRNDQLILVRPEKEERVDWKKLSSLVAGAVIVASRGTKSSSRFLPEEAAASAVGLRVIPEHDGRHGLGSAQADLFIRSAFSSIGRPPRPGRVAGILAILDRGPESMVLRDAEDFVRRYHEITGELPFVLGGSYLDTVVKDHQTQLTDCPLLVLGEDGMPAGPLSGWASYAAWVTQRFSDQSELSIFSSRTEETTPRSLAVPVIEGINSSLIVIDSVNVESNADLALQHKATVIDTIQLLGNPGIPEEEIAVLLNRYY